jgi:hypothetical protein
LKRSNLLNAEKIGVIAVILSLIFVAFEIRQNTDAVRSATIQAISEQSYSQAVLMVENPDLRAAMNAQNSGLALTEDQQRQIASYWNAALRIQQNRYLQVQLGILDEDIAVEGIGPGNYGSSFENHWPGVKGRYPAYFQEYIERRVLLLSE